MGQLILEWFSTYIALVANPLNRLESLYQALGAGVSRPEQVVGTSLQGASQILADAVLVNIALTDLKRNGSLLYHQILQVWRCWHILAHRRYHKMALVCLYIVEVGKYLIFPI